MFESVGFQLDSHKTSKIIENLSLKIKTADDCQVKILQETKALIVKIQSMCMEAVKIVKDKQ